MHQFLRRRRQLEEFYKKYDPTKKGKEMDLVLSR
jgi:hypothetical protein